MGGGERLPLGQGGPASDWELGAGWQPTSQLPAPLGEVAPHCDRN